jgi:hypothetical protein
VLHRQARLALDLEALRLQPFGEPRKLDVPKRWS